MENQNILQLNSRVFSFCLAFPAEEDSFASYSRLLLKYFLSEGVMCGHALLVASACEKPEDILRVQSKLSSQLPLTRAPLMAALCYII